MISFQKKQIIIDGKPIFLLSGELHYFRQPKENWQHLLNEAKMLGLNCIASYIPWILHEEVEGEYNFSEHLDLVAFLKLVKENGFYFFLRPGPFIMAEMKNEGIPYWVIQKHPKALPIGFDGEKKASTTLDYLNPGFLKECKKWYQTLLPLVEPFLHTHGGPIIGVQLDNEVGMLNWVTNTPVLNDNVLNRFGDYLKEQYLPEALRERYGFEISSETMNSFRSPKEEYSVAFHFDFGRYLRKYYAEYLLILKGYAKELGIEGVPFFINIHGTGDKRIFDFPLGISQLYEAYNADEGMISGTDVYLGEPLAGTYQDLYVINALTDCMNKKENPLTSIEFECSDAPYCSLNGMRYHPSATSHKMLLCLSQNARMLNFYVFSGGENYLLNKPALDGNGRMAFTGELHGMNAPVQPDGTHNYSFDHIAQSAKAIHALNEVIASSYQVTDGVTLGFIPDYFLTELCYKESKCITEIQNNLKQFRCAYQIDHIIRAMLGFYIHFDAIDLSQEQIDQNKALVILSARYMPKDIQEKLLQFVINGGRLLLYGEIPEYDLEGKVCNVLMSALQLEHPEYRTSMPPQNFLTASSSFGDPDQRINKAQCFSEDTSVIINLFQSEKMCGFIKKIGQGRLCAITCDYPADMMFFGKVFQELSIKPSISADYVRQGIYISRSRTDDNQELLFVINLDYVDKIIDITIDGEVIFPQFVLKEKASHILPLRIQYQDIVLLPTTAEILGMNEEGICFRPTQAATSIKYLGSKKPVSDAYFQYDKQEDVSILKFVSDQSLLNIHFTT
jgi:beta-galactosidase